MSDAGLFVADMDAKLGSLFPGTLQITQAVSTSIRARDLTTFAAIEIHGSFSYTSSGIASTSTVTAITIYDGSLNQQVFFSIVFDSPLQVGQLGSALDDPQGVALLLGGSSLSLLSVNNNPDVLVGRGGNDTIDGRDNDTLRGMDGNDTLRSLGANGVLNGGPGADVMSGGNGNHTYFVDNVGDVVNESGTSGSDNVHSFISYTLGPTIENLV